MCCGETSGVAATGQVVSAIKVAKVLDQSASKACLSVEQIVCPSRLVHKT